jgi:hypothetical protein
VNGGEHGFQAGNLHRAHTFIFDRLAKSKAEQSE